jgi:hypothetical protein
MCQLAEVTEGMLSASVRAIPMARSLGSVGGERQAAWRRWTRCEPVSAGSTGTLERLVKRKGRIAYNAAPKRFLMRNTKVPMLGSG